MSEIIVTLKGGIEIGPVKIYAQNCCRLRLSEVSRQ